MTLTTYDLNDERKIQLMKDTICKGSTNDEFELFAYTCKRLGLDPFARQIFPVKRYDSSLKREVMSIQTSIDGYRLIADRTGRYAPGKDPEFVYDKNGRLVSARAFVMKQTPDGKWHEVGASAHYNEYAALKRDGTPNHMWGTKPHIMLAKCAEALALRKAFPAELSGAYTKEEMEQADNPVDVVPSAPSDREKMMEAFNRWSKSYDRKLLMDYIEERSKIQGVETRTLMAELMKDEPGFFKDFETWTATLQETKSDSGDDSEVSSIPSDDEPIV